MRNARGALRRFASICCLLCFACLLRPAQPARATETKAATGTAVDLVILIDDSNSMYGSVGKTGNDPNKLRREAAAIMLNMCELVSSRAAVLSFSDGTTDVVPRGLSYAEGLIPISGEHLDNRQKLVSEVLRYNLAHANTNVGAALKRAAALFDATPPQAGNQRMVLLITDDNPYVPPVEGATPAQSQAYGEQLVNDMMDTSAQYDPTNPNGAHIYVVKLINPSLPAKENRGLYERITSTTGGSVYTAYSADDLPQSFAELLARQIGSTLSTVQAEAYPKTDGTYGINIRIPNRSVAEANILIHLSGIKADSITLYEPLQDGQARPALAFADGKSVLRNQTRSFLQYKIANVTKNGNWELTYALDPKANAQGAAQKPNATVLVLFSYDLSLAASLQVASGKNPLSAVEKNDTLSLKAQFLDAAGKPSTDMLLYQPVETVLGQQCGIRAQAYALPSNAVQDAGVVPKTALAMTPIDRGEGGFSLTCKPQELGVDGAGDYLLYINAEGDGLVRDLPEPIPFTVKNNQIVFPRDRSVTLYIRDPNKPGMPAEASEEIRISDGTLCYDADAGVDTLTLTAESLDPRVVRVISDSDMDDGVTLASVNAGQTSVMLIATDSEPDGTVRHPVPVAVVDVAQALQSRYVPVLTVTPPATGGNIHPIGGEVALSLSLTDTQAGGPVTIDGYDLRAALSATDADGSKRPIPLTRAEGQNVWRGTLQSGMLTRTATLSGEVSAGLAENGFVLPLAQQTTVHIGNARPVVDEQAVNGYRFDYWVEPSWLAFPWLGFSQPDDSYPIDLATCFYDDDDAAARSYTACILPLDAPVPATFAEAQALLPIGTEAAELRLDAGGQATLLPRASGSYRLVAAMRDGEGQGVLFTREVRVHSIRAAAERLALIIGGAALAAFALGWLLFQLFKPGYRGIMLELFLHGTFQDNKRLPGGKGKRTMQCVRPLNAVGAEAALIGTALSNIVMKPGVKNTLRVRLKRPLPQALTVELDNSRLPPRKWRRMRRNSMLTVRLRQGGADTAYSWKLVENRPVGGAGGVGGTGARTVKHPQRPS
jgi:hypothetical protein